MLFDFSIDRGAGVQCLRGPRSTAAPTVSFVFGPTVDFLIKVLLTARRWIRDAADPRVSVMKTRLALCAAGTR